MKALSIFRCTLLAGVTFFAVSTAEAQNAYLKIGGGYNFGIGSEIVYKSTETSNYSGTGSPSFSDKLERIDINQGKGLVFGGALGYMFNNNIGLELGVNYLLGSKNEYEDSDTESNTSFGQTSLSKSTRTHAFKSRMLLVQPSVVIASGLPKLNPYTRIGLVLAKGRLIQSESFTLVNSNGNHSTETEAELTGGIGLGLQAALGLNFNLNDNISIFTEGTFNNLSYVPEKGELTKFSEDGVDNLHTLETVEKEIIFEDEATFSSSDPKPSPSEPSKGPKERYTLNSVGVTVGFRFNF